MFTQCIKAFVQKLTLNCFLILLVAFIVVWPSIVQAQDLDITDEYLQSLDEEISGPEYLSKAKRELIETENREAIEKKLSTKAVSALDSLAAFENLLKTEYLASHNIYLRLSSRIQVAVFIKYKKTKKLSSAKRMIINSYLKSIK